MGIEIFATWKGFTTEDAQAQRTSAFDMTAGHTGYLFEEYEEPRYATKFLCAEAIEKSGARIEASVLRERLPHALTLMEKTARVLNGDERYIEATKQSLRGFVALCERKEKETGEPVFVSTNF
jgi:hypothetical protein